MRLNVNMLAIAKVLVGLTLLERSKLRDWMNCVTEKFESLMVEVSEKAAEDW
jgi:hypothetical protein